MTTSYPLDAALDAEIETILAGTHDTIAAVKNTLHADQKWECIERCEKAMACDGDAVATMNRLLDAVIATIGDKHSIEENIARLMAVREYHLPCLLDAFEVCTSHAD